MVAVLAVDAGGKEYENSPELIEGQADPCARMKGISSNELSVLIIVSSFREGFIALKRLGLRLQQAGR